MAGTGGREREEIYAQRAFIRSAIGPKLSPRIPIRTQALVVGDGVLYDQRFHAVGVRQDHAKTYRAAVILHVKSVVREAERFGEVVHDVGDVIERVWEFFRVGPVAVSEAGVIGRDHVIAIGKAGEERLEHAR